MAEEIPAQSVQRGFPGIGKALNAPEGNKSLEGQHVQEEIWINVPLKTFGPRGGPVFMISRRPQGYYVTHVEGKKFPKVNGKSIGDHPVLLQVDDVIEAGGVKLKFFMQPEDLDSR